jgi:hypothetical protein
MSQRTRDIKAYNLLPFIATAVQAYHWLSSSTAWEPSAADAAP